MPVLHLRNALRTLARRSVLPFGVAALLIAGLLAMHAGTGLEAMQPAHPMSASSHASPAPMEHSDPAGGCGVCSTDGGAMQICGMVLLAVAGLAAAAAPGILRLAAPGALRRAARALHSVGEPRPSLLALSISRT